MEEKKQVIPERLMDSYLALANAIVLQAVNDYKAELRKLLRNPDNESARYEAERLERFFYSGWCQMLTDIHPDTIVREVPKRVREEEAEKKRKAEERERKKKAKAERLQKQAEEEHKNERTGTES